RAGEGRDARHQHHTPAARVVYMAGGLVGALNLHDLKQAGSG
ncbi:arabinose 5-phosphate isomerase GutQ, partial [Serratia sp. IR-2025]